MAIIAGAGNPAGSGGTSGIGKGLNYIGEHAFAYNNYPAETTASAKLDFISGSGYMVGRFTLGPLINPTDTTDGKKSNCQIQINDETVATLALDMPGDPQVNIWVDIIIPPYSHVEAVIKGQVDSSSYTGSIGYTGRVYA
jgi:hypothetical protein